ncbi:hypothetical protein [Streptomyces sp. MUM 16J]|uniref:hypothetical protein n=1 Tax=Streptomyces sp. MUM 16J TaxID=2791988 RepID=UPI000A50CD71|nr:hypothetical protein [Streptomyces sp. MUM 16J]
MPDGQVLLAFQSGTEPGHPHMSERFGHEIGLDYCWRTPEQITTLRAGAGLEPVATVVPCRPRPRRHSA